MNNRIERFKYTFGQMDTTRNSTNESIPAYTGVEMDTKPQFEQSEDDSPYIPDLEVSNDSLNETHEKKTELISVKTKSKSTGTKKMKQRKQPASWTVEQKGDKTCCQICQEKFDQFAKLKTHYTQQRTTYFSTWEISIHVLHKIST